MRVTHLIAGDLSAGAAKGAYWLHSALCELGVDSTILTDAADWRGKENVISITHNKFDLRMRKLRHIRERLPILPYRNRRKESFSTGRVGARLLNNPAIRNADVVNLHWINKGFLKIKDIGKINKPTVWTLRDVWAMTGGCHVPLTCERYNHGCGCCPILGSDSPNDLTKKIFESKQLHYPEQMTIVGLSRWLTGIASSSPLLRNYNTTTIPNCIDTSFFCPGDRRESRQRLGLNVSKNYVLFGAMQPEKPHKGYAQFLDAINSSKLDFSVVTFGDITDTALKRMSKPFVSFGRVMDQEKLRDLYRSATSFVAPSLMESFGKTLAESLACGTPVVAFNSGGPADIVSHLEDGFLAQPFKPESLREGIEFSILTEKAEELCKNARKNAVDKFSFRAVATAYQSLYEKIVNESGR